MSLLVLSFSLHSNSAVDVDVKSRLVKDVLNLAGFMLPNKEDILLGPQPPTDWRYVHQGDGHLHRFVTCSGER